jgi:hypothetical protein
MRPSWFTPEQHAAADAAEARAAVDVELGITNLRHSLANAKEWKESNRQDGSRVIDPERAILAGHLRRIESVRP